MIRGSLTKTEKGELARLLKKVGALPDKMNCQITLHCAEGTVQQLEYNKIFVK